MSDLPLFPVALLVIEIGWNPNIAHLGGLVLTWHGVFTALGILAGVQIALRMAREVHYDVDDAYSLALVGVPSGILGARVLFVWEHWDFYGANPGQIIAITEGGISVWGAVIGGVLGSLAFAFWRSYPVRRGLDIAAFGLILGMAIGRLGDLVNGEHLAKATSLPWGVVYTNPESPGFAHSIAVGAHHPATTYELFGDLAILGVLFVALKRWFPDRPGLTFFVFLDGYAVMRFFLTYLRVDSPRGPLDLATPQLVSIGVLLFSLPFIWAFWRRRELPAPEPAPVPGRARVRTSNGGASTRAAARAERRAGRRAGDR